MASEFENMMNDWLKKVNATVNLTTEEKAKVTMAGAEVYKKKLEEVTREKHYSHHEDKSMGHMADSIEVRSTNIDKVLDGTSVVGFDSYHAGNARRINDGTKFYQADHFIDQARTDSADEVFKAEAAEYERILAKKGMK